MMAMSHQLYRVGFCWVMLTSSVIQSACSSKVSEVGSTRAEPDIETPAPATASGASDDVGADAAVGGPNTSGAIVASEGLDASGPPIVNEESEVMTATPDETASASQAMPPATVPDVPTMEPMPAEPAPPPMLVVPLMPECEDGWVTVADNYCQGSGVCAEGLPVSVTCRGAGSESNGPPRWSCECNNSTGIHLATTEGTESETLCSTLLYQCSSGEPLSALPNADVNCVPSTSSSVEGCDARNRCNYLVDLGASVLVSTIKVEPGAACSRAEDGSLQCTCSSKQDLGFVAPFSEPSAEVCETLSQDCLGELVVSGERSCNDAWTTISEDSCDIGTFCAEPAHLGEREITLNEAAIVTCSHSAEQWACNCDSYLPTRSTKFSLDAADASEPCGVARARCIDILAASLAEDPSPDVVSVTQ